MTAAYPVQSDYPKDYNFTVGAERLQVSIQLEGDHVILTFTLKGEKPCLLHWGLNRRPGSPWVAAPDAFWPAGTLAMGDQAVQTPFDPASGKIIIHLNGEFPWTLLSFVIHCPVDGAWIKDGSNDFTLPLPSRRSEGPTPREALVNKVGDRDNIEVVPLGDGYELAFCRCEVEGGLSLTFACNIESPTQLHWGLAPRFRHEWRCPDPAVLPANSRAYDEKAARTHFQYDAGVGFLELMFPLGDADNAPRGLNLLIYQSEEAKWFKVNGNDLYLPLFDAEGDNPFSGSVTGDMAEEIVEAEVGYSSWTLMHRFNLCHDLLARAGDSDSAWSLLFVWLRYSSIRQLDWQRRYNTQPRDLSHAQDRLTLALAAAWRTHETCRPWIRQLLTTLGRGGDGQQVRDEILNIMHRQHLKEVHGTFMEEWHQKLHNNTTPDDVVICQAYLAFVKSGGDMGEYWRVLNEGGVTSKRLAGFERAIHTEPIFHATKVDGLVHDFSNYLGILKRVHTGADFDAAVENARNRFDDELGGAIRWIQDLKWNNADAWELVRAITGARGILGRRLEHIGDDSELRDLLYLDLGLEMLLRTVIERLSSDAHDRDSLSEAIPLVLKNVIHSSADAEFSLCLSHWQKLIEQPRDGADWALHAKAVADRIGRRLTQRTSYFYDQLQPKAEYLGAAFDVDNWIIPLFSEEIIRGGELFVLSLLLRHIDPILRDIAGIGGWQVISPGEGTGTVHVVDSLLSVQGESYSESTVLVTDKVSGDEEIPEGVTSVITLDCPDLVSHVAVRARNTHVLFATCYDREVYDRLKAMVTQSLTLRVSGGGVTIEEGDTGAGASSQRERSFNADAVQPRDFSTWAVAADDFTPKIVGGKSNNLNQLRGRLPEWIQLPTSLAIPFGVCEAVLDAEVNRAIRDEMTLLLAGIDKALAETASQLRALTLTLSPPSELEGAFMPLLGASGLPPLTWEAAWSTIKRVWAAKWNDRACFSRRSLGLKDDQLMMAVLIQQVIQADYAYVIHTVNPLTGNKNEVYAELVLGMGETLVGNYPGRSLGFTCRKDTGELTLLSYPGKSEGLYSSGVIFRSDSNGEDLEGFAGAGLYDSYTAAEPERRLLDYSEEPLVWDASFRHGILKQIAEVATAVESLCGSPQDIEGAIEGGQFYVVQTRPQVGLD